jgi:hypothetical protein
MPYGIDNSSYANGRHNKQGRAVALEIKQAGSYADRASDQDQQLS